MNDDDQLRRGAIAGLSAYLIWGLLTVYWKQLRGFDAFELIGWRITLSAVVMAAVLTATRRWTHLRPVVRDRHLLGRSALAALLLTVNWTSYVWAVVHDHILETALGYFMAPLGTMMVGVVVLHERLRRAQWVAIAFAVAAVAVLTYSYGSVPWLALAIAVSWTGYGYLKRQIPLTAVESMAAESFILLVPALIVVVALAGQADSIPSSASAAQFTLVLFSGVATIVPLTLFAFAAQRVPFTILGPMQYSVPTMNFLLGWLVYHEALPGTRVIGFALVWVGLMLLTLDSARHSRASRVTLEPIPA